jgi:hypothetical protein
MKQFRKYEPNDSDFSKKPIKSTVYVIVGQDEKGNKVWLADTNIDLDFTNEQVRTLLPYDLKQAYEKQDYQLIARKHEEIAQNVALIKAQIMQAGKVVEVTFPLAFVEGLEKGSALFNFHQYYTAKGKIDNHDYEFKIQKGNFLSFRPEDNTTTMIVLTDSLKSKAMVLEKDVINENRSFSLTNSLSKYVYLGINPFGQVLKIRKQGL